MSATLVPMMPALPLILALHLPRAVALPTNTNVTTRAYSWSNNSNSSSGNNSGVIIATVLAIVILITFIGAVIRKGHEKKQHESISTQQGQGTGTGRTAASNRTPARRSTANYVGIRERTGNARIETHGARTGAGRTRPSRRPTQNSTKSLPVYNEWVSDGEVVLEQVRRRSLADDGEGDSSSNETENTPASGASPPYTEPGSATAIPRVSLTTISSRSNMSPIESLKDPSEDLGSDTATTASSIDVNVMEPTGIQARALEAGTARASTATDTDTSPHGNVPTYEEATATANHASDTTDSEAVAGPTGSERG